MIFALILTVFLDTNHDQYSDRSYQLIPYAFTDKAKCEEVKTEVLESNFLKYSQLESGYFHSIKAECKPYKLPQE